MSDQDVVMDGLSDGEAVTREGLPVAKSIQGYVVVATNVHEEATEEDVTDFFSEYGRVRSLHLNLDRQSGFVQGYVLVEYHDIGEAEECVREAQGAELMGQILTVDYAFVQDPSRGGEDEDTEALRTRDAQRDRSPSRA